MKHLHALTGLRGLAALIVFISHAANESLLPKFLGNGFGQVGVMLFFVLSGFLMSHLYVNEEINRANLKKYIFARIGRVLPLYFAMLFFSILITHLATQDLFYPFKFNEPENVLRALLLVDAKYVFWTIPVEIQFYVAFVGFWFLYAKGFKAYILFAYVLATMIPTIVLYFLTSKLPQVFSTYSFAFFTGVITALIFDRVKNNQSAKKVANFIGFPALVLLFVNLPELRELNGLTFTNNFYLKTWGDPITWLIVYAVFICATLNSSGLFILNNNFFVFLGSISYGFYLIHYPILMFFVNSYNISIPFKFIFSLLLTLALAHISFQYFETPVGKRIRNLAN